MQLFSDLYQFWEGLGHGYLVKFTHLTLFIRLGKVGWGRGHFPYGGTEGPKW